jgi:hypothetical protein
VYAYARLCARVCRQGGRERASSARGASGGVRDGGGAGRWEKMEGMGEELCVQTAHETPYGPVIQIDGELVLENTALDHL